MSPEFQLIVRCCSRAFGESGSAPIALNVDWARLLHLIRFHRVQGLVWSQLNCHRDLIPSDLAEQLEADARYIAAASLNVATECRVIALSLERGRIPFLFLKGLTLGALAYRNPALKAAADIDLLVAADSLEDVSELLRNRGYQVQIPAGSDIPVRIRTWHRRRKESLWLRPDHGVAIDLHTRLADNPRLIPFVGLHSPRQMVEVGGTCLESLATDELFAYLCVHGASSAWFRLKWITDFAALIRGRNADEIKRLYERSQELGAYRAADQALLLADALYGPLEGTDLRERLVRDRLSRNLFEAALRQLSIAEEPTGTKFGTWRIHWTQLLLKPGLGFKLNEASRQVRDAIF